MPRAVHSDVDASRRSALYATIVVYLSLSFPSFQTFDRSIAPA